MALLDFIKKLRDYFSNIPNNILVYGILPACKHCVYQRKSESVLIVSKERGPRIVVKDNEAYVRFNDCVGYDKCGKCFEQVGENKETLSCRWKKI